MPKVVKYSQTWFDCDSGGASHPKFVAGRSYPLHDDAERHVAIGIAELVDVRPAAKDAPANTEKAQAKAAAADATKQSATS